MKIYLDNVNLLSNSGPNNFAKRLVKGLSLKGHNVTWKKDNPKNYDVSLSFIEKTKDVRSDRPNVLRIDGIWFKKEEVEAGLNQPLIHSYLSADAVIVQSEFDSKMIGKFFGDRKRHVIRNGIEIDIPNTIEIADAI